MPLPSLEIKSFFISASQVVMYIIHTNQNRKNIQIHLNDIFLPSFFQIQQSIPIDTPIKKVILFFRIMAQVIMTGSVMTILFWSVRNRMMFSTWRNWSMIIKAGTILPGGPYTAVSCPVDEEGGRSSIEESLKKASSAW